MNTKDILATITTTDTKKATKTKNVASMSDAAREARNAYKRKWAKENPEKVRAANNRYWEKKAQAQEEGM